MQNCPQIQHSHFKCNNFGGEHNHVRHRTTWLTWQLLHRLPIGTLMRWWWWVALEQQWSNTQHAITSADYQTVRFNAAQTTWYRIESHDDERMESMHKSECDSCWTGFSAPSIGIVLFSRRSAWIWANHLWQWVLVWCGFHVTLGSICLFELEQFKRLLVRQCWPDSISLRWIQGKNYLMNSFVLPLIELIVLLNYLIW